jgi:alpha-galactosidase
MGNDLRTLSPSALTILNNPAVIAISQDPAGRSAARIRRETNAPKDKYGIGEIQVWSGSLSGGDQVLILLNVAGEDQTISASLEEIFLHDGPEGSAPQVSESWEVYDLWANRMDDALAKKILDADAKKAAALLTEAKWYNSTEKSYKDGLQSRDERLMGKKMLTIPAYGTFSAEIKSHSVGMFRLKSVGSGGKRKVHAREEL